VMVGEDTSIIIS